MKALKTKEGKLQIKVKKSNPIISYYKNPATDAKAARQFGQTLKNSKTPDNWKQVGTNKYVDIRPPINKK